MSSRTPPVASPGLPGRRTRWIGAGLRDAGRGLGFGALTLAGIGLLMALGAPLLVLALPLLFITGAEWGSRGCRDVLGGLRGPRPAARSRGSRGPSSHFVLAALILLSGSVAWWLLLPRILWAIRQLAQVTRWLAGEWCGVRIADPYLPCAAAAWGRGRAAAAPGAGRPGHRPRCAVAGRQRAPGGCSLAVMSAGLVLGPAWSGSSPRSPVPGRRGRRLPSRATARLLLAAGLALDRAGAGLRLPCCWRIREGWPGPCSARPARLSWRCGSGAWPRPGRRRSTPALRRCAGSSGTCTTGRRPGWWRWA